MPDPAIGWWVETIAAISTSLEQISAVMSGGMPLSGVIDPDLRKLTASLIGNQPYVGNIDARLKPALVSMAGTMIPKGDIAAVMQHLMFSGIVENQGTLGSILKPVKPSLSGTQVFQGAATAILRKAVANMVGSHPYTGDVTSALKSLQAAMSGSQTQQGAVAALHKAVACSMSGSVPLPLQIIGTPVSINGASVAIPTGYAVGDLIVAFWFRRSDATNAIVKPTAGGTVPTWLDIDNNAGANACVSRSAYFFATATDHTTGTWTNSEVVSIIVIRNANTSNPIGGHAESGGTGTAAIAPALTQSQTNGAAMLLSFHATKGNTTWAAAPAGYTRRAQYATIIGGVCLNTKDDTTSDGAVSQSGQASSGYRGQSVEILTA